MSELIDADFSVELLDSADACGCRHRHAVSTDRTTLTFVPSGNLATSTAYSILVSGLRDTSSNTMAPASFSFTTGASTTPDTTPPAIVGRTPTNGSAGVGVTSTPDVHDQRANYRRSRWTGLGTGLCRCFRRRNVPARRAVFRRHDRHAHHFLVTGNFPANATIQWYTNYNSTIRDMAGLLLPNQLASFTTANVPDTAGPSVQSVTPTSGATDVGPGTRPLR